MKHNQLVLALALVAAGCAPPAAQHAAQTGCAATTTSVWRAGVVDYTIEAFTEGQSCEEANAQLLIMDGGGSVQFTGNYGVSQVMTLAGAQTSEDMRVRLAQWIDQSRTPSTTAQLPEWLPGAEQPMSGEFPFYPARGVTRDSYEALRARAAPLFCYAEGMESLACIYLEDGAFQQVGAQAFPG